MAEKKEFRLNCDVCDARKVREEMLEGYENIIINADVMLVNEASRRILDRYPIHMNVDTLVEAEGDIDIQVQNGKMELSAGQALEKEAVLCVNGTLTIAPQTEEILKKYNAIIVNGTVRYPKSLRPYLSKMKVNGSVETYPEDCILLKQNAVIDKYFHLRAKDGAKYFARRRLILMDEAVDVSALVEKHIYFETPELLVAESMVEDAVLLVGDETNLVVVPDGCKFVTGSLELNRSTLHKYGTRLYIAGNLTLNENSTDYIAQMQYLYVSGEVSLLPEQQEKFEEVNAEYGKLVINKGRTIVNELEVYVDEKMLLDTPSGISVRNCVEVVLDENLTPEQIIKGLQFEGCVEVLCTKEQAGAARIVGAHLVEINTEKQEEKKSDSVCVNADTYVL